MSWPIILTADQSEAVRSATRDFIKTLEGEARALYAVVLNQMDRGVSLDLEEQEMVRAAILHAARRGAGQHVETAYFKLYGAWPIRPTYWEVERDGRTVQG
jgi:hypothetical protein